VHLAATFEEAASPDRGRLSVVISRSSPDPGIRAAKGEASFRGPYGLRAVVTSPTVEGAVRESPVLRTVFGHSQGGIGVHESSAFLLGLS